MDQIPQEGEFCRECPCLVNGFCGLFRRDLIDLIEVEEQRKQFVRLRECIEARPRIILGGLRQ